MLGIDSSLLGGGPPPMPFDPAVLEKQRMNSYDTAEKFTPADLFVARQSDVLRKYYEMMVDQVAAIGGPTEAGRQPELGGGGVGGLERKQPPNIGVDPHILGIDRARKKTRQEIQQELFIRKRSRKNTRQSGDHAGLTYTGYLMDPQDFVEEESSSGDEGFFTPLNNKLHNVEMGNGGIVGNGHLNFEEDGSAVIAKKKKKDGQLEPSDDVEQKEYVDNEVTKKKKKKEKKEKKEKKKKKKRDDDEKEEEE